MTEQLQSSLAHSIVSSCMFALVMRRLRAGRRIGGVIRYLDRDDLCRRVGDLVAVGDSSISVVERLGHAQPRRNELRIDWAAGSQRIEKLPRPKAAGLRCEGIERPYTRGTAGWGRAWC